MGLARKCQPQRDANCYEEDDPRAEDEGQTIALYMTAPSVMSTQPITKHRRNNTNSALHVQSQVVTKWQDGSRRRPALSLMQKAIW